MYIVTSYYDEDRLTSDSIRSLLDMVQLLKFTKMFIFIQCYVKIFIDVSSTYVLCLVQVNYQYRMDIECRIHRAFLRATLQQHTNDEPRDRSPADNMVDLRETKTEALYSYAHQSLVFVRFNCLPSSSDSGNGSILVIAF
jgi:hypothetical protein